MVRTPEVGKGQAGTAAEGILAVRRMAEDTAAGAVGTAAGAEGTVDTLGVGTPEAGIQAAADSLEPEADTQAAAVGNLMEDNPAVAYSSGV